MEGDQSRCRAEIGNDKSREPKKDLVRLFDGMYHVIFDGIKEKEVREFISRLVEKKGERGEVVPEIMPIGTKDKHRKAKIEYYQRGGGEERNSFFPESNTTQTR